MLYRLIYFLVNMEYEHQNHSKFLLMYHVIFVCKYRKKILEPIKEELKEVIHSIENDSDFEVLEMETDKDHIHLLIKSEPKISVLSIAVSYTHLRAHET